MKIYALILLLLCNVSLFGANDSYKSKHYVIISDLGAGEVKEFGLMMDAYHEYLKSVFRINEEINPLPLRIFGNKKNFQEYGKMVNSNFRNGSYGFCMYGDNRELVVYYDGQYRGIFFHEGLHQFIEVVGKNLLNAPQWFNEGLASYLDECQFAKGKIVPPKAAGSRYYKAMIGLIDNGTIMGAKKFMDIGLFDWNKDGTDNDYAYGACLIDFFINNDDIKIRKSFSEFIFEFKRHNDYKIAFDKTYGKLNYDLLDREFMKWCKKRG